MITELQKVQRQGKLGSSSAAAAMGLDPYRSPADVYLELTGMADGFDGNDATERGNLLEPVIVKWAEQQIGKRFESDVMSIDVTGLLCWNADAVFRDDNGAIVEGMEAKSTVLDDGLGEEGTDQIKEQWLVQVMQGFALVPTLRMMWVPVLLPGFKRFDFRMYRVERNDELAGIVQAKGLGFMRDHVIPRVPPTDFRPSLEVLKRVRREPNKIVPISGELLDKYIVINAAKKQAVEDSELAQAELIASLDDAEAGETDDGRKVTYMTTKRKGYTVEPTEYRSLRFPKTQKGQ